MRHLTILVFIASLLAGCNTKDETPDNTDYREEMRSFVIGISEYAKGMNPNFVIIPQNGIELISTNGEVDGPLHTAYTMAIDAHGQEDLFYGYNNDYVATPTQESEYIQGFLNKSLQAGNRILVIDYCSTPANMLDSYELNEAAGYVGFAADERNLTTIPSYPNTIWQESSSLVNSLPIVQNFLYLLNSENYPSKTNFINQVRATNYDLLVIDLFFNDGTPFTASDISQLREKANGGQRMVVCYMSIGEAEDYRYYWQSSWSTDKPVWLEAENPDWEGNYKVKYWNTDWQNIIYGNNESYTKMIVDAGFDGAYLDIIDGYEYFEE
ncbi:MAG: endo alpha-1,4 polygalactosaminidase [Flavobacteriales bacterium]|nr:endo alpha-1,4 polygalactosaminidase [Flavobacteriales bacterium]